MPGGLHIKSPALITLAPGVKGVTLVNALRAEYALMIEQATRAAAELEKIVAA